MAIGPIQLLVLGFDHPDFKGEVMEEFIRLRDSNTIRIIDSLTVVKDAEGNVDAMELSNLTSDEEVELGAKIGALIGLGADGEEGFIEGAEVGAEVASEDGVRVFDEDMMWDVIGSIPNDSAAALLLLEHHWAVPLRDAVARAGGFRLGDDFISPLELVRIGMLSAEEAEAHAALDKDASAD